MAEVIWTEQALDDLKAIHDFLARDTEAYAELITEELFERAEALAEAPQSGAPVPEAKGGAIREFAQGAFRLLYRAEDERLEILAICPGCRRD